MIMLFERLATLATAMRIRQLIRPWSSCFSASEPEAIGSANLRPTKEMKQARVVDGGLVRSVPVLPATA